MTPPAAISEVRPPKARGGWSRTVLVAVVVLLLGEMGARALSPHLPTPDLWADTATATKVAQLDSLADGPGCVDVLFVGSSMARDALDPGRFTAADDHHRSAYNAALDAASPALLHRWLEDTVLPRVDVGTVVIGVASFDFNDEALITAVALDAHERAPYSARGLVNRVEAWTIRQSALVRHRAELRDPQELAAAVGRWWRGENAARPSAHGIPGVIAPDGHGLSRRDLRYGGEPGPQRFVRQQLLNDFSLGGRNRNDLERLVGELDRRGIDVALLPMPVTDDYIAQHPRGQEDQAAFERALAELAERTGAALLRAPELDVSAFADTHHVNARGADLVSDALPGLLGAPSRPSPC